MKHKFIIALLLGFISICTNVCAQEPEDVAIKYFANFYAANLPKAYEYLSATDKETRTAEEFCQLLQMDMLQAFTPLTKFTRIKILSVQKSETTAMVKVEIHGPDFGKILKKVFSQDNKPTNNKELKKALSEIEQNEQIPTITTISDCEMVKEKDGWKIFFDWQAKKQQNDADKAEKNTYVLDKVRFYDSVINADGIRFKIKNMGDKTIKDLGVVVCLENIKTQKIKESPYMVITSPNSKYRGQPTAPLRPGQVWELPEGTFFPVPQPSDNWIEQKTVVACIEFEE